MNSSVAQLIDLIRDKRQPTRARLNAARSALRELLEAPEAEWREPYDYLKFVAENEVPAPFKAVYRQEALATTAWFDRRWKRPPSPIAPAVGLDDDEPSSNNALDELRRIMWSEAPLATRLACAEAIASYEAVPGSVDPADEGSHVSAAYVFAKQVSEAPDAGEVVRVRALKLRLACEARKATPERTEEARERHELVRRVANGYRGEELRRCGRWEDAIARSLPWRLEADDVFAEPEPLPPIAPVGASIAAQLEAFRALDQGERERRCAVMRERYLAVEAVNRPDRWRELLCDAAA